VREGRWIGAVVVVLTLVGLGLTGPAPAAAQVTDADVYVAEAVLALDDKQWDKALGLLRQALAKEPDHVEALYYTGVAYMGKKQPGEAVPVLLRARQKAPTESSIAYQLGLAYVALEQPEPATPVLEEVFAREPGLESLGYYVGFLRYRAGRYKEALEAFRVGRTADPGIADLTRLYTGLALQRLGLSTQAEAELSQVGQLRPASPLTGPAERLKSALATPREVIRRFRAEARVGFFYDDNAAAEPDERKDRNDPDVRPLRANNRETTGELLSLSAEYDWLRTDHWLGTVALSFVGTHNNVLPSFDIQDYTAGLRLSRPFSLFGLGAQAGFNYTYDYLVLDNDELVQRHAMLGYLTVVESARHLTSLQGRVEVKDYREDLDRQLGDDESQDAVNYLVGLVHLVRFSGDRHYLKAGYQFDYDDTVGRNYAYHGHRLLAGGQFTLPWGDVRLIYDFDVHFRNYLHANSLLPSSAPGTRERYDREYTHTVRVEVPLPWFTREQAFFVTAEYLRKDADSNLPSFEYHRNYGAIYFTWQY
jgi:tetratricopeptide (TPR) repeat protein